MPAFASRLVALRRETAPRLAIAARTLTVACLLTVAIAACGYRTPVRAPEDTAPVIPGVVTAAREKGIVVVRWKRADHSTDGARLEDLSKFVVERKRDGKEFWQHVATVDVVDQEKIRRRRDFSWHDTEAGDGNAAYRVRAVDADGQEGPWVEATAAAATASEPGKDGSRARSEQP